LLCFRSGKFAVKRKKGRFNRIASDQVIEQTINRDQKCHGGITGYSTTAGTVQRWVLTSHTLAQCQMQLEEEFHSIQPSRSKDLGSSRMNFDQECVHKANEVLKSWGNPFEFRETLIHLCSGVEASPEVTRDIVNAESVGLEEMTRFWNDRFKSSDKSFYAPLKKNKLKTFKTMAVKLIVNSKERSATIAAERSLFGRLLILAKSRENLTLDVVLGYSLSPIP